MTASFEWMRNEKTQKRIKKEFAEKGFNDVSVSVSTKNGESIYVNIILAVVDAKKLFKGMQPCEYGYVRIQIRMSDHFSGLEKNCGGFHVDQFSAKMTLPIFEALIQSGAIQTSN
jgi:hypothetical protein